MHVKVRSFNKMLNGLKREIEKKITNFAWY